MSFPLTAVRKTGNMARLARDLTGSEFAPRTTYRAVDLPEFRTRRCSHADLPLLESITPGPLMAGRWVHRSSPAFTGFTGFTGRLLPGAKS